MRLHIAFVHVRIAIFSIEQAQTIILARIIQLTIAHALIASAADAVHVIVT